MNIKKLNAPAWIAAVALGALVGSIAIADPSTDSKAPSQPEAKLPPGWTAEDMKACMMAGTPGKMQQRLARDAGVWNGKTMMWMAPGTEPMTSECTNTITTIMDGRYTKCKMEGEMPGMGPYHGLGIHGFDNVSEQFVSTWVDNHSTGIMTGVGKLSDDGKVLSWRFTANCPLTKKPVVLRQIETITGPNTKTLEMFGKDPKSGKEFKMMRIEFAKQKPSSS